jgi:hypothetical protein
MSLGNKYMFKNNKSISDISLFYQGFSPFNKRTAKQLVSQTSAASQTSCFSDQPAISRLLHKFQLCQTGPYTIYDICMHAQIIMTVYIMHILYKGGAWLCVLSRSQKCIEAQYFLHVLYLKIASFLYRKKILRIKDHAAQCHY